MSQTFTVHLKPISWNQIVAKNRWVYMKLKDEWREETYKALKSYKIVPVTQFPITVSIEALWHSKRLHDADGTYIKAVLDTLKVAKIIPDDNLKYIDRVILTGKIGCKKDCLVVTLKLSTVCVNL